MRRLGNIFRADGKTVIAAMDHGMGMNVNPALDRTGEILEAIVAGGADAILTTFGIAAKYQDILKGVGLILHGPTAATPPSPARPTAIPGCSIPWRMLSVWAPTRWPATASPVPPPSRTA